EKIATLHGNKKKKDAVLEEKDKELAKHQKQKEEKATIVNQLKGRQKELSAQIKSKRNQDAKIKNAIAAMIRREIEIAKAEAARKEKERLAALKKNAPESNTNTKPADNNAPAKVTPPKGSILVSSEADKELNESFEKNKGALPWPANGFVIYHFGRNQLPGGIDYDNPGVSIGTKVGEPVK